MGVAVLLMLLLVFGRYHHAATAAAKEAKKRFGRPPFFRWRIAPAFGQNRLHTIEQFLGNDRLMFSFIHFARITKVAIVNGVGKQVSHERAPNKFARLGSDSILCKESSKVIQDDFACCIPLECPLHEWRTFAVNDDFLCAIVIQISKRGHAGIFAPADFFPQSAFGIFRQRINVVFALAEHDREHEFSLRVGLKAECREFQVAHFVGVEQVNDASAVNRVARQTVGMPGENSGGLSGLYTVQHGVKDWPAGSFGGLLFNQLRNDFYALSGGESAQLVQLRINGHDLLVFNVG